MATKEHEPVVHDDTSSDRSDLRLLLPALTAWAVAALTLSAAPRIRTGLGLLALLAAVVLGWRGRGPAAEGRGWDGHGRVGAHPATSASWATPGYVCGTAAFVLAATALCLSASGMQGSLRSSGRHRPPARDGGQ
jgi:hypothetical protein